MSKYLQRGCYHFQEFANSNETYAKHIEDLMRRLAMFIGDSLSRRVHEVGCGEGLILNQIGLRLGWKCEGNDSDPLAVDMARRLCPHAVIHLHDEVWMCGHKPNVVLFCDSIEHIVKWKEHLEWAKSAAEWIVIAVPDRHDRHGERDFKINDFDDHLSGWKIVHREQRHARFLTIWEAP